MFRRWYGPTYKAFQVLGAGAGGLEADILALLRASNRADDGTLVVPADYVEVVVRTA